MAIDPDPKPSSAPASSAGRATTARGALGLAIRGGLGILLGVGLASTRAEQVLPFAMLASAFMLLEAVFVVALIALRIAHAREHLLSWGDWRTQGGLLGGLAVVCYGALLIRATTIAPVAFTSSLGAFTILFGAALLGLAYRLRPRRAAPPRTRMLAGPML
jgi:hypothetical protein